MCKAFEETRKEARVEQVTEIVDRMLASGELSNEKIADFAGVSLDFVLERAGQKTV